MGRRLAVLLGAAVAVLLLGFTSPDQPDPAEELTARSIARIALMDLRMARDPTPSEYRIAAILLEMAEQMTPNDMEIVRRLAEAAGAGGDKEGLIDATRRMLQLDPDNTVAQLRLISAKINRLQDADARLSAYDLFLGPRGKGLDDSVRSRLALDSALLLRERGDEQGFVDRLTLATQLDMTNKEAAALALMFFSDRVDDPIGQLDLMLNLLKADPIDPEIHRTIATHLAAGGAFTGAKHFHETARRLHAASQQELSTELDIEMLVLMWQTDGPQSVLDELTRRLMVMRDTVARENRDKKQAGRPDEELIELGTVRLPIPLERARLLAASAVGDEDEIQRSLVDLDGSVEEQVRALFDPEKRPKGMTDEQAINRLVGLAAQKLAMRLWIDRDIESAKKGVEALVHDLAQDAMKNVNVRVEVLQDWLRLREGDAQGAIDSLESASSPDASARLALALAYEKVGRTDEAIALLRAVHADAPLSLAGAWARTHLATLGFDIDHMSPYVEAMERFAANVPDWLDRMTRDPNRFVRLRAELPETTITGLDRAAIRLTLQNVSPIPLAVGADRAINSRLLCSPNVEAGSQPMPAAADPEVIDLDRRLRLMPREEIVATVWPDPGFGGWLQEVGASQTIRVSWRVLQGFAAGPTGNLESGPMCLGTQTHTLLRTPLEQTRWSADHLVEALADGPVPDLPLVLGAVRALASATETADFKLAPEDMTRLAEAAAARYPTLDTLHRQLMVVILPHARQSAQMAEFDEAVRAETDPDVLSLVLVTRVVEATDPLLDAAERSNDARLRELAGLVRTRLAGNARVYSRMQRQVRSSDGGGP